MAANPLTNCLNFVVLSHREMRTVSTAVYLLALAGSNTPPLGPLQLALAVADLGVMYLELFRVWFEWTHLARKRSFRLATCSDACVSEMRFV